MANSNGWGDGAANNSIGWGQGANNNIGWGDSHAKSWAGATDIVGITTDPASTEFFTATGITGATQQTAIDNLVKGLKADGLWSKMKAVYPFVTDNRNILSFTEDYSNAFWIKNNVSVTTNTTLAPDGTSTADTFQNTATSSAFLIQKDIAKIAGTYTQSFYFKKNNNDWVGMYTSDNGSNYAIAWFNVNTGVVGTVSAVGNFSAASSSILSVGNGWFRCSLTFTKPLSTLSDTSAFAPNGNNSLVSVIGQNAFLWGTQLENGSSTTTYQPMLGSQQAFISSQFKYNLVNPVDSDAAFRLVFNGGWTHSSNGATPNGTNGYADTKLVPSSVLSLNSGHFSYYIRNNYISNKHQIFGGSGTSFFGNFNDVNQIYTAINDATIVSANSVPYTRGNFIGTRTNSTDVKLFVNTNSYNKTIPSTTLTITNTFVGARNAAGVPVSYSSEQIAFTTLGDGLTDTEAANLYNAVQNMQISLSRNV